MSKKQPRYIVVREKQSMVPIPRDRTTGIVNTFDYLIAIAIVGFIFFILDDPMTIIHSTITGIPNISWARYIWVSCLVFFIIFGSFHFITSIRED